MARALSAMRVWGGPVAQTQNPGMLMNLVSLVTPHVDVRGEALACRQPYSHSLVMY